MKQLTNETDAQAEVTAADIVLPAAPIRRAQRMARQNADQPPAQASALSPRAPSKIDQVSGLLRRSEGATLAELVAATGWLPHTTRAALTGLRKKGHVLAKDKRGEMTCYRIAEVGE